MKTRPRRRTGVQVSILALGGSHLGRLANAEEEAEGIRAVHTALDLGINLIDTAPYYGLTKAETVLGRALRGVRRDRYLLATKVGRYGLREFDFSAARVARSFEESCARLGVDTIDLLQIHDIEFGDFRQVVEETLPALVKLRQAGRIRFIGINGLPLMIYAAVLEQVPAGTVDTVLSYCHHNLNDDSLTRILPRLKEFGVGVIHAAPTGLGMLTPHGAPTWHFAPKSIIDGCAKAVAYCRANGIDIVKLAVQFSTSHPAIATTVIGTAREAEVRRNVAALEEPVDQAALAQVLQILAPIHNHNFSSGGRPENQDPPYPSP